MAWLVRDRTGEYRCKYKPVRNKHLRQWVYGRCDNEFEQLKRGTIKSLIGRNLFWKDNPVEIEIEIKKN